MRTDETPGTATGSEQRLQGIGVSPGIAIGAAYIGDGGELPVNESRLDEPQIEAERGRFADAVSISVKQLRKLKTRAMALPGSAADEIGSVLDAHLAMLANSRLIRGVHRRIAKSRINAERAIQLEIDEIGKTFAAVEDPYLAARIDDIRVVGARLIRNLLKKPYVPYSGLSGGAVILAEEVTPADTALMDPRRVGGFAAELGGANGHTAIMARALGLPAVLGIPELLDWARAEVPVIIDGTEGIVILEPSPETLCAYKARQQEDTRERRYLARLRRLPATTRDDVEIRLEANVELPVEVEQALANGAAGLGLVRTEFLYMNREDLPGEDEQYNFFAALIRGMEGRPVTLRTLDVGGDKLPEALAGYAASDIANPALGLRAIRLSLKDRRLLDVQLAAMLRAANGGPVKILLPMISTLSEMRRTREALEQVARRLRRRGIPVSICGEIAGDPRYAALLLGLGLRELSMSPRNIPRVKQRIRNLDMVAAGRRARAIMDQSDSGRIAALLDDFNAMAEAR
jgi:phosphotransferase system enzyme I (PtsI)